MDLNINLERNHYYSGKRMDKEDLILEQNYFIDKIKTVNKMLVGYGIVSGLEIDELKNAELTITINKGIGVDNHGNFITLLNQKKFELPRKLTNEDYIYLKYKEAYVDRKPIGEEASCSETCTFNHIIDDMEIFISDEFFLPNVRNICSEKSSTRKDVEIEEALLYLGQYKMVSVGRMHAKKGIIDKAKRAYIHTNTELFKLLCKINQNHVSSVNGQNGDLSLVASIGDSIPNENGVINLVEGNNIKIETDDNEIKISTKGGFHKEYSFSLGEKGSKDGDDEQTIEHNRASYPIVDIYKKILDTSGRKGVFSKKELMVEARDLGMEIEAYNKTNNIIAMSEKIDDSVNKSLSVKNVLDKIEVHELSSKVLKILEDKINYHIQDLYIVPSFSYKKIVGEKDSINIEVSHLNNNTVKIKNLSSLKADILVILNT